MAKEFAKSFYNSSTWQAVRDMALKRDRYKCKYPECYRPAEEVHHKIELTEQNISDPKIAIGMDNLVSLCGEHHKMITKSQHTKSTGILPEIIFDDKGFPVAIPPGGVFL